jgi:hypothetical protein
MTKEGEQHRQPSDIAQMREERLGRMDDAAHRLEQILDEPQSLAAAGAALRRAGAPEDG